MRKNFNIRPLHGRRGEEARRSLDQISKALFLALTALALASCAKAKEFLLKNLEEPAKIETQEEKTSYTAGYLLGGNIKSQQSIQAEAFLQGLKDNFENTAPLPVSFEEIQSLKSSIPRRFTGEEARAGALGPAQASPEAALPPNAAQQNPSLLGGGQAGSLTGSPAGQAAPDAAALTGSSAKEGAGAGEKPAGAAGQQEADPKAAASGEAAAAKNDKASQAAENKTGTAARPAQQTGTADRPAQQTGTAGEKSSPPAAAGKGAAAGPSGKTPDKNKKFLERNKARPGVKTTASGLQYEALREGTGKSPSAADIVEVHYSGTLTDGTEFDSSYKRRESATFPLNQVIKGWTEGLQLMKEGAKYKFYIPPELGYGSSGSGKIPPNAALVFEVELLKVSPAAAAQAPPASPAKAAAPEKSPSKPAQQP